MPMAPMDKVRPHPAKREAAERGAPAREPRGRVGGVDGEGGVGGPGYVELAVRSNYSFLTGASHPEELVEKAAALGHAAAAIADVNTLAGVVRAHVAAKEAGIGLVVGSRVRLSADGPALDVLCFPTDRAAYGRLCRLLTLGKRRAPKGACLLGVDDLLASQEGLLGVVMPPAELDESFVGVLGRLREGFGGDRLSVGLSRGYGPDDEARLAQTAQAASRARVALAACNDVLYHTPDRRALQDVLTCIRHGCTVHDAGRRLEANAERHLKTGAEMARLLGPWNGCMARSVEIARRAQGFGLDQLKYEYPAPACPAGVEAWAYLEEETWAGAAGRYPDGVPEKVASALRHELGLIRELKYEAYFLTCYDIVRFARGRGIFCQGRGGAANSAVCYCLGITEVDPARFSLLFERFVSRSRNEPPDIDIDFEHERREEVIQYLYAKYGRDRAALTAEVISYRGRSAVREVGKAMGLSADCVDAMAKSLGHFAGRPSDRRVREAGLNPEEPTIRRVIDLSAELAGFPRHLSQHVGGFVITRGPLEELVPIENAAMEDRTVIEWDKDDIDAMGMLKVDILGLGMLTCIRKALAMVAPGDEVGAFGRVRGGGDDPAVYDMLGRADSVGVFQVESRAQMSMLPRLRPREFYDLVIEVAIVRPGPIQGGMVHPYLRRRSGEEAVTFPRPEVRKVLGRTLGVPIFQEQAMQLSIVAAGFTPDQADALRRAMAAWRRRGDKIFAFGKMLIEGMEARGYPREFAEQCFRQIQGFSEYGFPESHAASFAILVYVSAWLKRYEPAVFAAALLNSQPMGFYAPAQIIRDAKEHGVTVRGIDVNHSGWDCSVERPRGAGEGDGALAARGAAEPPARWGVGGPALRLGMRLVKGLAEDEAGRIAEAVRRFGRFDSVRALWRRSGVSASSLRCLAQADAFGSMGLDRQAALWQIKPLRDEPLPLFDRADSEDDEAAVLPTVRLGRQVLLDYASTGLSLKAHPVSLLRHRLEERGAAACGALRDERAFPTGRRVRVGGVVLVRQRPGTASGVVFVTLEDETGIANLIIWGQTFEKFRKVTRLSTMLLVGGRVQRQGEVVHVHADHIESLDAWIPGFEGSSRNFH
jgi:error-prone DNA polymerase